MSGEQNSSSPVPLVTPWTAVEGYDPAAAFGITPEVAAERDELFRQFAIHIAAWRMPLLLKTLSEAGARMIGVAPETFQVLTFDGQLRCVPDIEAHLNVLPWREPGETCQ